MSKHQKKEIEVEFEKDDTKAQYLELFDKDTELKSLSDEIEKLTSEKDLELMKCDKDIYKSAEPLYRERRALLLEIPEFWSTIFTNLFLTLGFVDELTMCIDDFFVEDTETEFRLYIDFRENDIISNKQVVITVKTPTSAEELTQEVKITTTPIELKQEKKTEKKNKDEDEDDDEEDGIGGFLKFLLNPTKDIATFIVGSVWSNPIASFCNDDDDDDDLHGLVASGSEDEEEN
ncbi:hypothetical protein RB653_002991 [Dictyostelium firmibasis]|uniref:Uncharacterized protein n=1 Tax=Dictyostelium firmibasis TaxID=79012 RepID=A0AAN7U3T4_9MYCE